MQLPTSLLREFSQGPAWLTRDDALVVAALEGVSARVRSAVCIDAKPSLNRLVSWASVSIWFAVE